MFNKKNFLKSPVGTTVIFEMNGTKTGLVTEDRGAVLRVQIWVENRPMIVAVSKRSIHNA